MSDARVIETLEAIVRQSSSLRQGGPDPMDLHDLSASLEVAIDLALDAIATIKATPTPQPAAARGGEVTTLRTLLDNLVIAQSLSRELRQHATDQARSYLYQTRRALSAKGGS